MNAPRLTDDEIAKARAWTVENFPRWLASVIAFAVLDAAGETLSPLEFAARFGRQMAHEWEDSGIEERRSLTLFHLLDEQTGGAMYQEVFALAVTRAEESAWIRVLGDGSVQVNPKLCAPEVN